MNPDISTKQTPQRLLELLQKRIFRENTCWAKQLWRESTQLNPAIAISQILQQHSKLLVVLPSSEEIQQIADDLQALGIEPLILHNWSSSLYKGIRSQNRLFTKRSSVLARILLNTSSAPLPILCSLRSLAKVLPPPAEFRKQILQLQVGSELQPSNLAQLLSSYGYYRVPRVSLPGEFALRGQVLDFYPPEDGASHTTSETHEVGRPSKVASQQAVRVMFGFDEVEMLKVFDISSQISQYSIASFSLYPLKEVLWHQIQLDNLRQHLEETLLGELEQGNIDEELLNAQLDEVNHLLGQLAIQQEVKAEELLFPFAWQQPASILDYIAESPLLFWGHQRIEQQEQSYLLELETLYEQSMAAFQQANHSSKGSKGSSKQVERIFPESLQRKLLHPKYFAVDLSALLSSCAQPIIVDEFEGSPWPIEFESPLQYYGNINRFTEDLSHWLEQGFCICIGCSSKGQAQRLHHMLQATIQPYLPADHQGQQSSGQEQGVHFFPFQLSQGMLFPKQKLVLVQEWEILGNAYKGRHQGGQKARNSEKAERIANRLSQSQIISSFVELREGDTVVHVQHGVGRFKGIERVSTSRMERDYLALEYANGNTLFVPIEQVNMVQRYIGSGGESSPKLDRIGGKAWQERKAKTQKAVEDMADRLLRLYTRRAAVDGFACAPDDELVEEFEADFPYDPTTDQLQAVVQIKEDLESPRPMDRLLCGDVGFGKTEVAMRASFKVASQGRQVLVLCPTTILAEQHYQNFSQRFSRFPLRVAMLSRFVERKQQKEVLDSLEHGKVDILIGTHRILAKDIHFHDLGLIVVDEEQRFGVKHKERLKMLKTSVDSLTMSATPIPRTLHMSLVQIRDISMLTTPPRNRQPVETFVREFNPQSIANAIRHELSRNGQVFYLHNRVEGLEEILIFLRDLVPEALIEMAHGQMDSKMLEDIMYRFVHGGFNVLLATTIIENGIDIPNVNTIIIDRADRYGIGQLYQLRGRVGRSAQLAYAYLFYPDRSGLSDLALKRLKIISDFTELGSGFKVAMKDLEVRGAGNLLGPEQSGNIISVGFEMYSTMLAQAMNERKYQLESENQARSRKAQPTNEEVLLELDYSGFIPDTYIPDATEKIELYKRISSIDRAETLIAFYEELFDRFGNPPSEVHSLLSLAEVRILCCQVGINCLKERGQQVELQFSKAQPLPLEKIMQQIQRYPKVFRIDPKRSNALLIDLGSFMEQEQQQMAGSHKQTQPLAQQGSKSQAKRNANYLGYFKQEQPQQSPTAKQLEKQTTKRKSESPLLQKTTALHKLLSSFQG